MSRSFPRTLLMFAVTVFMLRGLSELTYRESWMKKVMANMGATHELLLWVGITLADLLVLSQAHGDMLPQCGYFVFLLSLNVFLFWVKFTQKAAKTPLWLQIASGLMLTFTAAVVFLFGYGIFA